MLSVCLIFSVSPFGATPRSARSDHNLKSIEDELEEDIEEDLSVAEDLLKSDNSGVNNKTANRFVVICCYSTGIFLHKTRLLFYIHIALKKKKKNQRYSTCENELLFLFS